MKFRKNNITMQKIQYLTIPIHKKISKKFSRNITKTLDQIGNKICMASYSTAKVENYFSLKDTINRNFSSCLVYRFTCPEDLDTQYIGKTKRQLFLRIKEHTKPTNSTVFNRIDICSYC